MKSIVMCMVVFLSSTLLAACGSDTRNTVITTQTQYDLDGTGPYAVGFTRYVITDPLRAGDGTNFQNRPIAVYVWYPVDPEMIKVSTPEAVYPLHPLYDDRLLSLSSDWEKYGANRAYQTPMPSGRRPFPLFVFSHGSGSTPYTPYVSGHTSREPRFCRCRALSLRRREKRGAW